MSILYFAVKGNIATLFDLESRDGLALYPFRGHLTRDLDGNAVNLHGEMKLAYVFANILILLTNPLKYLTHYLSRAFERCTQSQQDKTTALA